MIDGGLARVIKIYSITQQWSLQNFLGARIYTEMEATRQLTIRRCCP
jgi:hypothetical protein